MAALQNKRKRESQDIGAVRVAPGLNQAGHEFDQHYLQTDDDGMDNSIDFSAMVNNTGDPNDTGDVSHDPGHLQAQAGDGASAETAAAAAAMAQYHTMTVPQSTEQSFMTQPTEGGNGQGGPVTDPNNGTAQPRTSSFGDFDASGVQGSPNGDKSPSGMDSMLTPSSKPAVGSDEWHKIRKDNHKEGESCTLLTSATTMLT
jgi:transcriptional regulator CBF1